MDQPGRRRGKRLLAGCTVRCIRAMLCPPAVPVSGARNKRGEGGNLAVRANTWSMSYTRKLFALGQRSSTSEWIFNGDFDLSS